MLAVPLLHGLSVSYYFLIISILGAYIAALDKLYKLRFTKRYSISIISKISAILGFLSLLFLILGIGFIFAVPGLIFSIIGIVNRDRESRKATIYALFANLATIIVLTILAWTGYQNLLGLFLR